MAQRQTGVAGGCFQCVYVRFGQGAGSSRAIGEHFLECINAVLRNKQPELTGITRRRFVVVKASMLGHRHPLHIEIKFDIHPFRNPTGNSLRRDANNFPGLPEIVKPLSGSLVYSLGLHSQMYAWVSVRTLRAWNAREFKSVLARCL